MKTFYVLICRLYNYVFTKYEELFFRSSLKDNSFEINYLGYEKINYKNDLNIVTSQEEININQYIVKKIVPQNSILKIINYVLSENSLAKKITERTGFAYSVDFLICYETFHVPEYEKDRDWYANKWHNDKPFTKNTLKIIIPLNDMSLGHGGGIEILNIDQSLAYEKNKNIINDNNYFIMNTGVDKLLILFPNICYHKAGNPDINNSRKQIMMQLNPSKNWCINSNIFKKQYKIEPKFPFFNYLFDKKRILNL